MADYPRQGGGDGLARLVLARLRGVLGTLRRQDQPALIVLAIVVGAASAYGTIAFRWVIGMVQWGALGGTSEHVYSLSQALPWWQILLVPAAIDWQGDCVAGFRWVAFQAN